MHRREFLAAGGLAAASPLLAAAAAPAAQAPGPGLFRTINFWSDGLALSPAEYAALLAEEIAAGGVKPDNYSRGGLVASLEAEFARRLGKPAAMFVPTGTLANHLAVRKLAGGDRRVLVPAESHLYNDSGDMAQALSGLNLVPLAPGQAGFGLDEARDWVRRSAGGRVQTPIGALVVESPVRRQDHQYLSYDELRQLSEYARGQGIGLHLDGARLFNLPLHTGRSVAEFAALFDTVYVSLWKHFNGAGGAVLAGEADFIEGLYHERRMFGGALPQAWPQVALVPRFLAGYEADYARAWQAADVLIARLEASGRFRARKPERGTCRFFLAAPGVDLKAFSDRAHDRGLSLPYPAEGAAELALQVNPTLLRATPDDLAGRLLASLPA